MKRILNGVEISECFDKDEEFDAFYENLKKGEMPTTTQLNPFELKDYFEDILKKNPKGDLIHVSLSSGLSNTFNNAKSAAEEVNKHLESIAGPKRHVYVIDSLMGTLGIGEQVEELVRMRDEGASTEDAVKSIEDFLAHQQGWVIMTDLFHLKRGGRISGAAAAIGSVLNIRPIVHLTKKGKLAIENKIRGNQKAVKYILSRMEKYGDKYAKENGGDFINSSIWIARTSNSELFELVKSSVHSAYPNIKIKIGIVGSVVGTHLGGGGVAVLFHGAPRLDID